MVVGNASAQQVKDFFQQQLHGISRKSGTGVNHS